MGKMSSKAEILPGTDGGHGGSRHFSSVRDNAFSEIERSAILGREVRRTVLRIIVCDDDRFTLELSAGFIKQAAEESGAEAKIACLAASGAELLQFTGRTEESFLYFLDFDFGKAELNGIDLARRIYQNDPEGKIVFVTSHAEKGMEILKSGARALGFIEKSPNRRTMVGEYKRYLRMAAELSGGEERREEETVRLPIGIGEEVCIPVGEITFVDSVKSVAHSICYHTFDGSEITLRDTLEHAEQMLGSEFIRCHRSVLVNRAHVISLKNGVIRLANGDSVVCAMGKRRAVMEQCFPGERRR